MTQVSRTCIGTGLMLCLPMQGGACWRRSCVRQGGRNALKENRDRHLRIREQPCCESRECRWPAHRTWTASRGGKVRRLRHRHCLAAAGQTSPQRPLAPTLMAAALRRRLALRSVSRFSGAAQVPWASNGSAVKCRICRLHATLALVHHTDTVAPAPTLRRP
jgi:hypothetical protein